MCVLKAVIVTAEHKFQWIKFSEETKTASIKHKTYHTSTFCSRDTYAIFVKDYFEQKLIIAIFTTSTVFFAKKLFRFMYERFAAITIILHTFSQKKPSGYEKLYHIWTSSSRTTDLLWPHRHLFLWSFSRCHVGPSCLFWGCNQPPMTAGRCNMDQTALGRYALPPCSYAVTPVPVSINPFCIKL